MDTDAENTGAAQSLPTQNGSRLRGYIAAEIAIEQFMQDARKKEPKRLKDGYKKRAEYRQGYIDGLILAHCFQVWGQSPDHPENAKHIEKILSLNDKSTNAEGNGE